MFNIWNKCGNYILYNWKQLKFMISRSYAFQSILNSNSTSNTRKNLILLELLIAFA